MYNDYNLRNDYYNYLKNNYNQPTFTENGNPNKLYDPYQGFIRGNMFKNLYNDYKLKNPVEIFKIWHGGMSFHGGLIGAIIGAYFLCKKYKVNFFEFCDLLSVSAPIGLFLGRIANFINLELYGRTTTSKIGVIFPNAGDLPRHPSQLYEAFLEGFVLFLILFFTAKKIDIKKHTSLLSGIFLIGYGFSRFIVEFFREPDWQIGYILKYFTMGQILTIPIILLGSYSIIKSLTKNNN